MRLVSDPFGPLTVITAPSMFTSTPFGIGIGALPILDIISHPLPHITDYLAAYSFSPGILIGHYTFRSGYDRYSQASKDLRNVVLISVDSKSRLTYAFQTCNRLLLIGTVLQVQPKDSLLSIGHYLIIPDISLFLKDLRDV